VEPILMSIILPRATDTCAHQPLIAAGR